MGEKLRVIIAARLSSKRKLKDKKGDPRNGIGLESQDVYTREWATEQGMTVVETVPDTKSGTVAPWDRKNLRGWVTDPAKLALYDAVVAYSMDRLSRGKQTDFTRIEQWALDNGKSLIVREEDTRYPSRNDRERDNWDSAKKAARRELEKIAERNDRMQRTILDAGGFVGNPPWGWDLAGEEYAKKPVATDQARALIPGMYARVLLTGHDTMSNRDIARWLAVETGYDWNPETVSNLVRNPMFRGHAIHRMPARFGRPARTWDHPCEALVDSETWDRANRELDRRAEKARGGRKPGTRSSTLLAGVARCPRCAVRGVDSPMTRIKPRQGLAYRCRGRGGAMTMKGCGNMVPASVAESLMGAFMADNQTEIMRVDRKPPTDYDQVVREAKNARRQLDQDAPDYDERHEQATAAVKRAEAERDAHQGENETVQTVGTGVTYAQRWAELDDAGRGGWLRKSGVLAYFARNDLDAGEVLRSVSSGSDDVWAMTLQRGDGTVVERGSEWTRASSDLEWWFSRDLGWARLLRDEPSGVVMLVMWNADL